MITILFFAQLQEEMGKESITYEAAHMTVSELKEKLKESYQLTQLEHVMISINEEYALQDDILLDGDVVAFIPPVSGG